MEYRTILNAYCAIHHSLVGCERWDGAVTVGPFDVKGETGVATGQTGQTPMSMRQSIVLSILLTACFLVSSCKGGGDYKVDTVTFVISGTLPPAAGPAPNIHIDTNTKASGMTGGTVKSRKPYSVGIDFTDETFTYAEAEITKVTVTYDDGSSDPGAAALQLPLSIRARPYETTNSVSGGRIVKTKVRVISGKIPGSITRDEPLTLRLEGNLIKDDGSKIPFAIKHEYNVVTDKSTKPWGEVMQDR